MSYIEFIGSQGVGKTTLLNALVDAGKPDSYWKTYREAIGELTDKLAWNRFERVNGKFLYPINKCNVIGYKREGIRNMLINEAITDFPVDIQKRYEYLVDAQFRAFEQMEPDISSINKIYMLEWHIKSLNRIFTLEMLNYDKTVIFDEGPLKTHYGLQYIDRDKVCRDTLPRAVVYCYTGLKKNKKRIYSRKEKTGRMNRIHNELNNETVETMVEYVNEVMEKNMEIIRDLGVPVYEIKLSKKPGKKKLGQLIEFLDQHSK